MDAPVVVVDLDADPEPEFHVAVPAVILGLSADDRLGAPCDVVLAHGDGRVDAIIETARRNPIASVAFVQLLRSAEARSLDDGILAESAVYSSLQAGPEFRAWRESRSIRERPDEGDAVQLRRDGDVLHITLDRPHVRNALNTKMRDQLVDALDLAVADDAIDQVHLWGEGEAFCSGGDLDEFGSFPDPATAHLVRIQQSVGRRIAAIAERVTAHLHGACLGSGIELPAFARRVVADPTTSIGLPELSLGLVPGAGGTVSLPRRIGRQRTALLGLTGAHIDAETALAWGLVDSIA
jgi:enoyl-CoA hydratase/carnithine racemase